jgi:hypothetical protein
LNNPVVRISHERILGHVRTTLSCVGARIRAEARDFHRVCPRLPYVRFASSCYRN